MICGLKDSLVGRSATPIQVEWMGKLLRSVARSGPKGVLSELQSISDSPWPVFLKSSSAEVGAASK